MRVTTEVHMARFYSIKITPQTLGLVDCEISVGIEAERSVVGYSRMLPRDQAVALAVAQARHHRKTSQCGGCEARVPKTKLYCQRCCRAEYRDPLDAGWAGPPNDSVLGRREPTLDELFYASNGPRGIPGEGERGW